MLFGQMNHLNFSSLHQDIVFLILSSRNSVLKDNEVYIKHSNITKYFKVLPIDSVPEPFFFLLTKVHDAIDTVLF